MQKRASLVIGFVTVSQEVNTRNVLDLPFSMKRSSAAHACLRVGKFLGCSSLAISV